MAGAVISVFGLVLLIVLLIFRKYTDGSINGRVIVNNKVVKRIVVDFPALSTGSTIRFPISDYTYAWIESGFIKISEKATRPIDITASYISYGEVYITSAWMQAGGSLIICYI